MRKVLFTFLIIFVLITSTISVNAAVSLQTSLFDLDQIDSGLLKVSYSNDNDIKLMIQKDTEKYYYDLLADGSIESFPLQMGSGKYIISVLEKIEGNRYRYIAKKYINVDISNEIDVFLNSVQNINWDIDMDAIVLASELTNDKSSSIEKVRKIYEYIVKNIRYDRVKFSNAGSGYIPDIRDTFKTNLGFCYDYASLFAAMLRSQNIPVKLVTGYVTSGSSYHAWNEVYLKETNEWVSIDTTFDAGYRGPGKTQMIKDYGKAIIKYTY